MLDQFRAQKLEWNRANNQIYDRVETSSGDSNGRTLFVQISNSGTVEDLTGATLSLAWNKKTEQGLESFEEVDAKKGQFRLFYPTGMLVNHGVLQASLVLVDVTGRIESKPFDIIVHKGTVDDEAVESDDKFTALTTALVKVSQVQAEFDGLYADKSQMMDTLHDDKKADMEALEQDYANRANTLETTYVPRLTGVEGEIDVARGGEKTLGVRLDKYSSQLTQANGLITGNYNHIKTTKSELNTRIDAIIATPTTVSEQEIIDARQGEPSLGANLLKIKSNEYKYKRNITSEDNLENIMESGIYFAFNTSPVGTPSVLINVPFVLRVDNFSEAYCLQTIYSYLDSNLIYTRYVYTWATPKATPFLRVGGGYQKIIGSEINLNVDKLADGLYWVLVSSQPLNAPSQLSSVSYMIKQELYHGQNYAIQTAYNIQKPQKMYKRWVYYFTGETTSWSLVGDDISVKPLTGKKLLTLGDSITFGAMSTNHYQDKIAEITGAEVINAGYSGAKYALITGHEPWNEFSFYQRSLDYDLTDIEYMFVMYGTNDFGNHVPIGTMVSDEYTVKGALVKGLTNLFTKKPDLKIFFSTPIFRATYDGTDVVDLDTKTNDLGLTIHDYSQAVIEVCEKFRIPVFDAQKECGINQLNQSVYLADKLHPNNDGNDLIGTHFGRFINQYI